MILNKINSYLFVQISKYFILISFIFLSVAWLLQITRLFTITNFMNIGIQDILFLSFYLIPNYTALENVSLTLEINKILFLDSL